MYIFFLQTVAGQFFHGSTRARRTNRGSATKPQVSHADQSASHSKIPLCSKSCRTDPKFSRCVR
jgi:hypothetical protein